MLSKQQVKSWKEISLDSDHGGIDVGGGRKPSGRGEADHVGVIGDHVSIPCQVLIPMIFLISYRPLPVPSHHLIAAGQGHALLGLYVGVHELLNTGELLHDLVHRGDSIVQVIHELIRLVKNHVGGDGVCLNCVLNLNDLSPVVNLRSNST